MLFSFYTYIEIVRKTDTDYSKVSFSQTLLLHYSVFSFAALRQTFPPIALPADCFLPCTVQYYNGPHNCDLLQGMQHCLEISIQGKKIKSLG